jgi:hypothetical protein
MMDGSTTAEVSAGTYSIIFQERTVKFIRRRSTTEITRGFG